MFEFIGLAIATALLMILAAICAVPVGLLVWFVLRGRGHRIKLTIATVLLPFAVASFWWICTAVMPGVSLFANIDQPLPNGYRLKALGKMPEFGYVEPAVETRDVTLPQGWIAKAAIQGDLLYGQYKAEKGNVSTHFFVMDTKRDTVADYASFTELETVSSHAVQLVPLTEFLSPAGRLDRQFYFRLCLVPAIVAYLVLFSLVLRARFVRKTSSGLLF
jgi:hypothetical protein